ncbi:MAG: AAA family ATPase [Acidimicrobiales bacterium]
MGAREELAVENMGRQLAVVDSLAPGPGAPAAQACLGWMAMRRQASTYLRHVQPQVEVAKRRPDRALAGIFDYQRDLQGRQEQARTEIEASGPDLQARARAGLGIRLAVIGKGGAGKTFVSSVVARTLASMGRRVLAVDLDTCPGLALSMGVPQEAAGLPLEAVMEHPGAPFYGWQLSSSVTPAGAVERFATTGPDGVAFLGLDKIGSEDKAATKRSVAALIQILLGFGLPGWDVVADLEAGPTTPFERYHSFSDEVAVVVGPAWRSAMTARRLLPMAAPRPAMIVANRWGDHPDHPGLTPALRIPADPEVVEAERRGLAPFDACPDAPAVAALRQWAGQLVNRSLIEEVVA